MELIGQLERTSDRKLWYVNKLTKINTELLQNWLFVPIVDDDNTNLWELAKWCMDYKASYVCCIGTKSEKLHDLIDDVYSLRDLNLMEGQIPDVLPLTTWDFDFSEGLWFSLIAANHPDVEINNLVCLDTTSDGVKNKVQDVFGKVFNGWVPSDGI